MSLFLLGFLLKGSQKFDCQLLICLFAADNKGINYFHIKIKTLTFLNCAGLKITTLHICQIMCHGSIMSLEAKVPIGSFQL